MYDRYWYVDPFDGLPEDEWDLDQPQDEGPDTDADIEDPYFGADEFL
jgi:hypothetical protein